MRTYVIADIGANHDGDPARMRGAIDEAAHAGCSAVKFQWVSDPYLMAHRRGFASDDGYAAIYDRYLAWPDGWHEGLALYCRTRGIDYMCTVFLERDIAVVAPHVSRFKVASFEASDVSFMAAHAGHGKPVLVSTGMMDHAEALAALHRRSLWPRAFWEDGTPNRFGDYAAMEVVAMHCVSSYPAPLEQSNLALLRVPAWANGGLAYRGFSDHTNPALTWTGALAVAAGAQYLEAHLRLDGTSRDNPDYPHAMSPAQFWDYVDHVRFAELALGGPVKAVQPCEAAMSRYRVRHAGGGAA